jgi:hypothetical protein
MMPSGHRSLPSLFQRVEQNAGVEHNSSVVDQDGDLPVLPDKRIPAFLVSILACDIEHVGFGFAALLLNNTATVLKKGFRSTAATVTPSCANSRAMARLILEAAPVTTALRPSSFKAVFSTSSFEW